MTLSFDAPFARPRHRTRAADVLGGDDAKVGLCPLAETAEEPGRKGPETPATNVAPVASPLQHRVNDPIRSPGTIPQLVQRGLVLAVPSRAVRSPPKATPRGYRKGYTMGACVAAKPHPCLAAVCRPTRCTPFSRDTWPLCVSCAWAPRVYSRYNLRKLADRPLETAAKPAPSADSATQR